MSVSDIQRALSPSELEKFAESDQGYKEHDEEDAHQIGARAVLLHCDDEDLNEAKESLHEILTNPDILFNVHTTERGDAPYHFFIYRQVFPYHDSFNPDRFAEAVRTATYYRRQAVSAYLDHVDLPIEEGEVTERAAEADETGIGRDQPYQ